LRTTKLRRRGAAVEGETQEGGGRSASGSSAVFIGDGEYRIEGDKGEG